LERVEGGAVERVHGERGEEAAPGFHVGGALQRRAPLLDALGHRALDAALDLALPLPGRRVVFVDTEGDLRGVQRRGELALALEPLRLRAVLGRELLARGG